MWFTRSTCTRSKIILEIATRCGELRGNPKQHCWLQNTWYVDLNGEPAGCTATKITSQNLSRCSRNISIRNNSLKTWVRSRRSTNSARTHNNYSSTWTTQRSSSFARIAQNINVLIAMPSPNSGSYIAVAGEIWSTRGVLQHSRRPIAILLQSLDLSLIIIPVEDQHMVSLKDRWCSTRRSICLRKQDKVYMATIRQSFEGGTNKLDTESHWRITILAERKSCFTIASLLRDTTKIITDRKIIWRINFRLQIQIPGFWKFISVTEADRWVSRVNLRCDYRKVLCTSRTVTWEKVKRGHGHTRPERRTRADAHRGASARKSAQARTSEHGRKNTSATTDRPRHKHRERQTQTCILIFLQHVHVYVIGFSTYGYMDMCMCMCAYIYMYKYM